METRWETAIVWPKKELRRGRGSSRCFLRWGKESTTTCRSNLYDFLIHCSKMETVLLVELRPDSNRLSLALAYNVVHVRCS
ncbi:hypothetical protein L6452_34177 [Arctium lappa]|uniref:Uncharacterized protein n=1 Tax=Arctium lappa TaxID=4217 RepID=A0ACB8YIG3_ARCLA|nr:hypothetical protein L6452_34177 [Arctium lappa]